MDSKNINGTIYTSEHDQNGNLVIKTAPATYIAYVSDDFGAFRSITGQKLRRVPFKSRRLLEAAKDQPQFQGKRFWESDVNPAYRLLEKNYPQDDQLPDLRISIYDIEVDRDPIRGYSMPDNPFCPIISVTVYHKWSDQAITLAVAPPDMPMAVARKLCVDPLHEDGYGVLDEDNGYYLVADETQLLEVFAEIIQETDILTGWNSEFYDLPYIINRARHVIGGESLEYISKEGQDFLPTDKSREYLEHLSVFRVLPKASFMENYGRRERTFQLLGRCHVDYLALYKKFIRKEGMFALDAILRDEVGQTKVKFDGSIDEFYRREFRRFLAYNRQDVMGLNAVDNKLRLIAMANQMIHMSGVTFDKAVGSVAIIEQAVLRELHRERGEIAWDHTDHLPDRYVPGAFVVEPRAGKYGWGGSYDVNSLYPTMIRLLNISPETMIGQLDLTRTMQTLNEYVDDTLKIPREDRRPDDIEFKYRGNRKEDALSKAYTQAWHRFTGVLEYHDVIDGSSNMVKLVMPDTAITMTGRQMRDYIKENNYCITANGTVFDLSKEGIIPFCLTKWYNERIEYQKKSKKLAEEAVEAKNAGDTNLSEELYRQSEFYNMVQNAKKLFLNSTYGAYLNRFFRFYDPRCGRSVTLSGRVVDKHMCRKACELLIGEYDFNRDVLLGGDTDSTYISFDSYLNREGLDKTLENVTTVADRVGDQINESFVSYLSEQFLVPPERCKIVQVKRETVFDRAIFKDKKKRYAMHVLDKEGKSIPKGHKDELKIVGMETRRSDTPKIMQDFLQECLRWVLVEGYEEEDLRAVVDGFRGEFRKLPSWKQGSPVRVRNLHASNESLEKYDKALDDQDFSAEKPLIYYAVTAAKNTNILMKRFKEQRWELLKDGDKVDFLYLQPGNEYRMDAVAVRSGEEWVPDWFKNLPFDNRAHEIKLIDKKLDNTFGGLNWDFSARDHDGHSIFT